MMRMRAAKARRQQKLGRFAEQFLARITEELLCLRVDQSDGAIFVDAQHTVGSRFDDQTELFLGRLLLAVIYVHSAGADDLAGMVGNRLTPDQYRDDFAIARGPLAIPGYTHA